MAVTALKRKASDPVAARQADEYRRSLRKRSAWPPDYRSVFEERQARLLTMRSDPRFIYGAREYYSEKTVERCIEFINHWCDTYDPRKAGSGTPAYLPFILFKRQEELVEFIIECILNDAHGLIEKCRDMGATYVAAAVCVWLWLYWPGISLGWGSRKEQLVDKLGDPDSIFEKIRLIVNRLPPELLPQGYVPGEHSNYMRLINPETGSTITGESGDNIGRGGRKRAYFKDESAHYIHPEVIEAALMENTNVQIDISSVHGVGNVFHTRRMNGIDWKPGMTMERGKQYVLVLDWREHPGKTQTWYDERRAKYDADGLLHLFAQEVDRDYSASIEGVIIPAAWVASAIDAHIKLGLPESGQWAASLDVADEGGDTNAFGTRKGIIVNHIDEWGEGDPGESTRRVVSWLMNNKLKLDVQYDCVGIGVSVKSEAKRLTQSGDMPKGIRFVPWSAGSKVLNPKKRLVEGDSDSPTNEDFFFNLKAQGWWELRGRFERTHRAINEPGYTYNPDTLISLSSKIPLVHKLRKELSQPTKDQGGKMLKLVINKKPEGTKSPNLADMLVMLFWPVTPPLLAVTGEFLARASQRLLQQRHR